MAETKAKAINNRERFPTQLSPLEGKENGGDQGKGYSRQIKVPWLSVCVSADEAVCERRWC
jgi:hypothetical protein